MRDRRNNKPRFQKKEPEVIYLRAKRKNRPIEEDEEREKTRENGLSHRPFAGIGNLR